MRRPRRALEWAALGAIVLGAAILRLVYIGKVSPDPFYDAAVRSMTLSWHNFFFGAFEPSGSVSIDKPPVDLWLQVVSVKLLGFSSTTLKLPEVLAGIASVVLVYEIVRRIYGAGAGLAAAAAMAVLPVEVITARSDTMDAVMMALLALALLTLVRAAETGRRLWLLAAAAALGLAFNVKLLESIVALPGLAVFAYLALPGSRARRLTQLSVAGVVYVAVALSWLTATLLAPAHDRPYAIGSTNGSAWNAAFVFNGSDRLGGKTTEPGNTVYEAGHQYPVATQSERDHIPIVPPSPTRLLARIGPLSGERLGSELLIGLLLGLPALLWWGLRRDAETDGDEDEDEDGDERRAAARLRIRRAAGAGIGLWLATGIVLFSHMIRLHPRYVEGFTPAVAATLGIGAAWASSTRSWPRLTLLAVTLAVSVYYDERLLYGTPGVWWVALAAAILALAAGLIARSPLAASPARARMASAGVLAMTLVSVLAMSLSADVTAIETHVTDAGYVGALPTEEQNAVSAYVNAHNQGAYYELASESSTQIGSLIVSDAKPILVLTSYAGRVFTPVAKLQQQIAQGRVRYAFLTSFCGKTITYNNPACAAPVQWVRAHGKDVSRKAGLGRGGLLWLLPGAKP
jgi:4-amino-4-deoxy-L-arabinose transferase-like glycosyltransferase